jgi:hypothetical protein
MTQSMMRCIRMGAFGALLTLPLLVTVGTSQAAEPKEMLKRKEVKALVVSAKTPADHMKLARHFTAMAEKHEAEASEHDALAVEYTRNPRLGASKIPMAPNSAEHCKYYAEHCRKAAKEMRAMAAAHEPTPIAKHLENAPVSEKARCAWISATPARGVNSRV